MSSHPPGLLIFWGHSQQDFLQAEFFLWLINSIDSIDVILGDWCATGQKSEEKIGQLFNSVTVHSVQRAPAWANNHVMAQGKRSCNLIGLTDGCPPRTRGCPPKKVVHPKNLSNKMVVHILNKYIFFCLPPSWSLGLRGCIVDTMGDSGLFYWEDQPTTFSFKHCPN